MRLIIISLCLFSASSLRVCGNEESEGKATTGATSEASGAASASVSAKAALAAPRIGGSVVALGDFAVEVLLHKAGLIEALVTDAQGKLVTEGVKLNVAAQASAGKSTKVELGFVPARARFEGRADSKIELASGPVDVNLDVKGKAATAKLNAVVVPTARLGGAVLVAGGFSSEIFVRPSGEVLAFVRDAKGADVTANAGANFKVRASAKGGAMEEIALAFDAPRACFAGKAKGSVELAPGPLEFVATAGANVSVGRLDAMSLAVDTTHGGQLVMAGDYSVELVANGPELKAFVFDANGKAHAAGDLDMKVDVGADAGTKLGLTWDAGCLCYKGKAKAKLDLSLQPLRLAIVAAGKASVGAVASLKAAADAKINGAANLDAKAKLDADAKANINAKLDPKLNVKAPDLKANAKASADKALNAAAKVNVAAPKVDVKVNKSASASAATKPVGDAKAGAKASAGFSFGTK